MDADEKTERIAHATIGAAIEVHRHLGPGFLESVYEAALAVELKARGISFARQVPVSVTYKDVEVGQSRLDLLVDDRLIVELKAADKLLPIHKAQALSYLRATDLPLALLINFKVAVLREGIKRVIRL
ncbi:MAG: GxxExxY protein [Gammaproteobacteria bacterium]